MRTFDFCFTLLVGAAVLLLVADDALAGRDFYKILGLRKTASKNDVKKAYR